MVSSPFKSGKGDILKSLAASAQKYGLKLGVYLSPADLYQIENPKVYMETLVCTEREIYQDLSKRDRLRIKPHLGLK